MAKRKHTPALLVGEDNLVRMRLLKDESVDLIYLDPPFNKSKTFYSMGDKTTKGFDDLWKVGNVKIGQYIIACKDNPDVKAVIDALHDTHGNSWFAYLSFMAIRLIEMRRVLKPTGSIYLHCDSTMSHAIKILMDVIFGHENYRSEIIWRRGWVSGYKSLTKGFAKNHDTIFYYVKDIKSYTFNKEYLPYRDGQKRSGKAATGKGFPLEDTWNCNDYDKIDSEAHKSFSRNKSGYPTQKPLLLLQRIIQASSNEGDLVLDPFCGCATTCIAAHKLNRDWIGMDINEEAIIAFKTRMKQEKIPTDGISIVTGKWDNRQGEGEGKISLREHCRIAQSDDRHCKSDECYCNGCALKDKVTLFTIDHIVPKAKGGLQTLDNVQLLCSQCNSLKGDRDMGYLYQKKADRIVVKSANRSTVQTPLNFINDEIDARILTIAKYCRQKRKRKK